MNMKKTCKRFLRLGRGAEGFTLVELIVVIAILAILAGVAVPVYSTYVEQANRSADEQLLGYINQAFQTACAINGQDYYGRNDVEIVMNGDLGNLSLSEIKVTGIADFYSQFQSYFDGSKGAFKTVEALIYNPKVGGFVETTKVYAQLYASLKAQYGDKEIKLLAGSILGAMGAETLLTEAGSVVNWANTYGLADLSGDAFNNALLSYLGIDTTNKTDDQIQSEINAAFERLGGDGDQIIANAVALYAAQNTAGVTSDALSNWLNGSSTTESMKNSANATTLAEAAAIYGLYMAYQGENFSNEDGAALNVMEEALTDENFAAWVKTDEGKAELEAYKAAMEVVNGATSDADAMDAVLTNGLDDPELIKLLESLMGN